MIVVSLRDDFKIVPQAHLNQSDLRCPKKAVAFARLFSTAVPSPPAFLLPMAALGGSASFIKKKGEDMTTEQLNVIVTAQTADFQEKINAVNESLERTIALAKASAGTIAQISTDSPDNGFARQAEMSVPEKEERTPFSTVEEISGASASVLSLRRGETLIGAVNENGSDDKKQDRPIEIFTTVELDGEKVGESVSYYNSSRNRITNGRN